MTLEQRPWVVVVVEDDENLREHVREYLEGEEFAAGKIAVIDTADFDEALGLLRERKVDLVVLDVYRGDASSHDSAGLRVLQDWRAAGFAPVILHTALPESVEDLVSPFVRLVAKEAGSLQRLRLEIDDLFVLKIPQIGRAVTDHVDNVRREYMWSFVERHWSTMKPLLGRPDFMRLVIRRLAADLSRAGIGDILGAVYDTTDISDTADVVHPTAYYVKPPVGPDVQMGDLRRYTNQTGTALVVVLWPSCDLVERKGKCKVTHALCAVLQPLDKAVEYQNWIAKPTRKLEDAVRDLISNNRREGQAERFHFLPAAWDIPASIVDFQNLLHVSVQELKTSECPATVASPFAEHISNRFMRYVSRLGTPDLDVDSVIESLRPNTAATASAETRRPQ